MLKTYLFLDTVSGKIQKVLAVIAAFCSLTGLAAVFFQVIYRYIIVKFTSFSFPFTEEYARFTTIWMTYLCAGICMKEGYMVSLNILYDKLPDRLKSVLYYATRIPIALFLYLVIYYSIVYLPKAAMYTSPVLRLSGVYLYTMPIIGSVLMLYEMIVEVIGVICGQVPPFGNRSEDAVNEEAEKKRLAAPADGAPDGRKEEG